MTSPIAIYYVSIDKQPAPARLVVTQEGPAFLWSLSHPAYKGPGSSRAMRAERAVTDALGHLAEAFKTGVLAVTPEGSPTVVELIARGENAVDPAHLARVQELATKAIELARAPKLLWASALDYAKHLGNLNPEKAAEVKDRNLGPVSALADTVTGLAVQVKALPNGVAPPAAAAKGRPQGA
jgi:hypothetical protein